MVMCLVSWPFIMMYAFSLEGLSKRSLTSAANSGERGETSYVVKLGSLGCYSHASELGLHLGEPKFRVRGPEWWKFQVNHRDLRHGRAVGSQRYSTRSSQNLVRDAPTNSHCRQMSSRAFGVTNVMKANYPLSKLANKAQ